MLTNSDCDWLEAEFKCCTLTVQPTADFEVRRDNRSRRTFFSDPSSSLSELFESVCQIKLSSRLLEVRFEPRAGSWREETGS